MSKYSPIVKNRVLLEDCYIGLEALPDNCIDACVTDPPYGLGFMGKKWDHQVPAVQVWEQVLRVLKPGAHILVSCGTRTQHRMGVNIEDAGFEIRDVICWLYGSGFPKSHNISKAIDKSAGAVRQGISQKEPVKRMIPGADQEKTESWIKNNGRVHIPTISLSATSDVQKWEGWGTALKPATELWTLARKPISEKSIADNVRKWGTGALNINASKISFQNEADFQSATFGTGTDITGGNFAGGRHALDSNRKNIEADPLGRWPANVILDEAAAVELDAQTGELTSGKPVGKAGNTRNVYGKYSNDRDLTGYGDTGGASRFFYVAKPSAAERGPGNVHPTVKPLMLMSYLIRLICPLEPGRIVLDAYAGSGTTCIAARQLGLDYVAFENDPENFPTIERRFQQHLGLFR